MTPSDLRYSKDHEWVRTDGVTATIGITALAADQLGDIVFVELPPIGTVVTQHQVFSAIESVKAVSDLLAPVSGTVIAANDALGGSPDRINTDPYGDGWIVRVTLANASELDSLLDADAYEQIVTED